MIETLASGLILAAISGLAFLAYKHPRAYASLYYPGVICFNVLSGLVALWALGVYTAMAVLRPYIDQAKLAQAEQAISSLLPNGFLLFVLSLGVNSFAGFLKYLPKLLERDKDASPDEPSFKSKD